MDRSRFVLIGACIALGLAACGSDKADTVATDAATTTVATVETAPSTIPPTVASSTTIGGFVDVHMTVGPGGVLTDGDGRTVYLYAPDSPGFSKCVGCDATWPGVYAKAALTVDDSLDINNFGTLESGQLTFEELPLYYYVGDTAPGDTNGDGIGGVWSIIVLD